MKKFIVALGIASLAFLSTQASAAGRYNNGHYNGGHYSGHGHRGGNDNFVPFVIGAAITGAVIGSVINSQREPERVVEYRTYEPPPPPPRVVKRYYYEAPPPAPRYEERRYYYYDEARPYDGNDY